LRTQGNPGRETRISLRLGDFFHSKVTKSHSVELFKVSPILNQHAGELFEESSILDFRANEELEVMAKRICRHFGKFGGSVHLFSHPKQDWKWTGTGGF